jgi:hypothetical protein
MFEYNFDSLKQLFRSLIEQNTDRTTLAWLDEKAGLANDPEAFAKFKIAFSMVSRKVDKRQLKVDQPTEDEIRSLIPGFTISGWTLLRLCRAWLVMQVKADDRELYIARVEDLFRDADMNELATLYASLPLLAYAEHWEGRCAEGVRSNIGYVLDAVMMDNPYPWQHLSEEAWNQLVLKAFFTDKDISRIIGLQARLNANLVKALNDYAAERKAAGREVNPELWNLVNSPVNN